MAAGKQTSRADVHTSSQRRWQHGRGPGGSQHWSEAQPLLSLISEIRLHGYVSSNIYVY